MNVLFACAARTVVVKKHDTFPVSARRAVNVPAVEAIKEVEYSTFFVTTISPPLLLQASRFTPST